MANGSNNDVDRALAVCGAPSMQYRNFEEVSKAGPDPRTAPANNHAFPLLLDALPEVGQVAAVSARPEQPAAPVPEPHLPIPAAAERTETFAAPGRVAVRTPEPHIAPARPVTVPRSEERTPRKTLSSVFHTLSAAGPTRGKTAATTSGLQGVFSRL